MPEASLTPNRHPESEHQPDWKHPPATVHQLISHHLCPYVQRAVIVLLEKDIPHGRTYIDLVDKPSWFLALSPTGKVPVLQTGGVTLFESQVIAEYLDETTPGTLHPVDPLDKARHRAWIEFGSATLNAIGALWACRESLKKPIYEKY